MNNSLYYLENILKISALFYIFNIFEGFWTTKILLILI
jgi:hypothetical protein